MGTEIIAQKLCTGNGGTANIEYQPGAKQFYWAAKPKFSSVYSFVGEITVYDGSRVVRVIPLSKMGAAGGSVSGTVSAPSTNGEFYDAELTGIAKDINAIASVVVPNCEVPYNTSLA